MLVALILLLGRKGGEGDDGSPRRAAKLRLFVPKPKPNTGTFVPVSPDELGQAESFQFVLPGFDEPNADFGGYRDITV